MSAEGFGLVEKLFRTAVDRNANDIHLTEGIPPTLRIAVFRQRGSIPWMIGAINQTLIPTADGNGVAAVMEILLNTAPVRQSDQAGKGKSDC